MKGQAALEFLMTYGWAILAILAAVAAFTYFGVLDTTTFVPESCVASSGFTCKDFSLYYDAGADQSFLSIYLQNDHQETINVFDEDFANTQAVVTLPVPGNESCTCDMIGGGTALPIRSGDVQTLRCGTVAPTNSLCNNDKLFQDYVGQKMKVRLDFTFERVGKQFNKTGSVDIVATVREN